MMACGYSDGIRYLKIKFYKIKNQSFTCHKRSKLNGTFYAIIKSMYGGLYLSIQVMYRINKASYSICR